MHKNQIGKSRTKLNIYKNSLSTLTQKQKEISIGFLLGDVSIQTQNKGRTYRLKFEQGYNHKDYIDHLISVFDPWILSRPRLVTRMNKNKSVVQTWQCQTISHEAFNELAVLFLEGSSKKTISPSIVNHFTTLSFVYWFMDDGGKLDYTSNEGKAVVLNTQGFLLEQAG
jgi:LAGLIDADG DNA endonuclease family